MITGRTAACVGLGGRGASMCGGEPKWNGYRENSSVCWRRGEGDKHVWGRRTDQSGVEWLPGEQQHLFWDKVCSNWGDTQHTCACICTTHAPNMQAPQIHGASTTVQLSRCAHLS
eukprot:349682-Chlamydomonas_euryale.AAC.11